MHSFLDSEYPNSSPEKAGYHIIPVPLERTVSFGGGTAKGPEAILDASGQLEDWDGISAPGTKGFYTHAPINCSGSIDGTLAAVTRAVSEALSVNAVPVTLGGEHTVSYGPIRALAERSRDFGILHFDAHCDLRDIYEGDPFSHACVLRRVVDDFGLKLAQFGTRDYSREEAQYRLEHGIIAWDAYTLSHGHLPKEPLPPSFPRDVYITFDVDGFDSSLMPATGTPSPGGLSWSAAQLLLERCLEGRRVIGLDVVELAPIAGLHHADFTAAKLVHMLMGMAMRSRMTR